MALLMKYPVSLLCIAWMCNVSDVSWFLIMEGSNHSKAGSIIKRVFNPFYIEKIWMLANLCILDFDLFVYKQ